MIIINRNLCIVLNKNMDIKLLIMGLLLVSTTRSMPTIQIINDPHRDLASSMGAAFGKGLADGLEILADQAAQNRAYERELAAQKELMELAHQHRLQEMTYKHQLESSTTI